MSKITNVELVNYSGFTGHAAVAWVAGEAHFHVWIKISKNKNYNIIQNSIIFKNPLLEIDRHSTGYFDTRKLDGTIPKNAAIIQEALDVVVANSLIDKAIEAELESGKKRQAANEAAMHLETVQKAGPELLAACELALALIKDTWIEDHGNPQVGKAWGALADAIDKAQP